MPVRVNTVTRRVEFNREHKIFSQTLIVGIGLYNEDYQNIKLYCPMGRKEIFTIFPQLNNFISPRTLLN